MRGNPWFVTASALVAVLLWLGTQPDGQGWGMASPPPALASSGASESPNVGGQVPTPTPVAGTAEPGQPPQTPPAPTFAVPTATPFQPTATRTPTRTPTPLPPTATLTSTPLTPTATRTATRTATPLPPTATSTSTPVPPTATKTSTPTPPPPTPTATPGIWRPALITNYQIQFTGTLDTTVTAELFEFDAFDTPASVVAAVRAKGAHAACYLNAGAWEDWRPDAGDFPSWVLGNGYDDWPGERWIDIRQLPTLAPIFHARMELCRTKGFEAVEFDNVDSYTHPTGFPLTADHQLIFNIFLADLAHQHGLSAGLKNDLEQVPILSWFYDWALNEECFEYGECHLLSPFVQQGKAVFIIEYTTPTTTFCPQAAALGMNAIRKRLSLDAWRQTCP